MKLVHDTEAGAGGLLRFTTAGSVDDGKSTLIGRILHDAKAVPQDQIEALERAARRSGDGAIDLSLLTDGLTAEREQGITIDVAYRYFATRRRKFIIADTPGHEQYTRNMVTGASTADLAIVLVDVRKGLTDQTRRHLYLSNLLGIRHLLIAVNKMDLVGYQESAYSAIAKAASDVCTKLSAPLPHLIPISAKLGDNVVHPSDNMPWYRGPALLTLLETVPIPGSEMARSAFRFPVQIVSRPRGGGSDPLRLYMGRIESGEIRVGDRVVILPAGTQTKIASIKTLDGDLDHAAAPQSVAVTVADDIDIARGDMLVHPDQTPRVDRRIDATLCWFGDDPFDNRRKYLLKQGTRTVGAKVAKLIDRVDVKNLQISEAPETLMRNDIGRAQLVLPAKIAFDSYRRNRATGAFILIDEQSNATVAAGMID
ncbi:MAG: sulfate adenylyltransferase [Rhodospirillaceae bacterium]|nr:sulfate adenylyltransferase [Rhodospirillaceae bacterium]